jgi:hypothetical protein
MKEEADRGKIDWFKRHSTHKGGTKARRYASKIARGVSKKLIRDYDNEDDN